MRSLRLLRFLSSKLKHHFDYGTLVCRVSRRTLQPTLHDLVRSSHQAFSSLNVLLPTITLAVLEDPPQTCPIAQCTHQDTSTTMCSSYKDTASTANSSTKKRPLSTYSSSVSTSDPESDAESTSALYKVEQSSRTSSPPASSTESVRSGVRRIVKTTRNAYSRTRSWLHQKLDSPSVHKHNHKRLHVKGFPDGTFESTTKPYSEYVQDIVRTHMTTAFKDAYLSQSHQDHWSGDSVHDRTTGLLTGRLLDAMPDRLKRADASRRCISNTHLISKIAGKWISLEASVCNTWGYDVWKAKVRRSDVEEEVSGLNDEQELVQISGPRKG